MKTLFLLGTFTAMILAFSGDSSMSSTKVVVARSETVTVQTTPRFSSRYTRLTGRGCGSGMTKKEEREAEKHGSDIPTRCKGPGGYDIFITYSACNSYIGAEKGSDSIPLASQSVAWKQQTVEWRMAQASTNAKTVPFAVIMREYEYAGDDHCATGGKVTAEFLIVKGLDGFEHIDEKIDLRKTRNPNLKARQIADKKYGMSL